MPLLAHQQQPKKKKNKSRSSRQRRWWRRSRIGPVQSVLLKAQFDDVNQISHGKKKEVWRLVHKEPQIHQKKKEKVRSRNKTKPKRSGNGTRDSYSALVSVHAISSSAIRLGFGFLVFLAFLHCTFARKKRKEKKKNCVLRKAKPSYYK